MTLPRLRMVNRPIGAVVCLGIVGGIFALMIKPTQDNIAAQKAIYDANAADAMP